MGGCRIDIDIYGVKDGSMDKKVCENNLRFWQEHNLPVTPYQSWQTTQKIFLRFDTTRETLAPFPAFH